MTPESSVKTIIVLHLWATDIRHCGVLECEAIMFQILKTITGLQFVNDFSGQQSIATINFNLFVVVFYLYLEAWLALVAGSAVLKPIGFHGISRWLALTMLRATRARGLFLVSPETFSGFAVIFIFIPLTTYETISFTE